MLPNTWHFFLKPRTFQKCCVVALAARSIDELRKRQFVLLFQNNEKNAKMMYLHLNHIKDHTLYLFYCQVFELALAALKEKSWTEKLFQLFGSKYNLWCNSNLIYWSSFCSPAPYFLFGYFHKKKVECVFATFILPLKSRQIEIDPSIPPPL